MSLKDNINKALKALFTNGVAEVGLEVGADVGLNPNHYIHIPKSLSRKWAYKTLATGAYELTDADTIATLEGKNGWTVNADVNKRVVVVGGLLYVRDAAAEGTTGTQVYDVYTDPPTVDDVKRFVVANMGHIRDTELDEDQHYWVHAVRFWSVVSGLVLGSKQREYTFVDDPTDLSAVDDNYVSRIVDFRGSAFTATSARAASWRKTNHALGGDLATGFPRRWLQQNKWWVTTGERAVNEPKWKQLTTAFYVATHAAAVHNTLALMASNDPGHWAVIDPVCGLITRWDIRESTKVRIAPLTQVAGTAMVVDSVEVFKMLLSSGLVGLLQNVSEWRGLLDQYRKVEKGGVAVASYAGWFLDGHPLKLEKQNFNQKSSVCAQLVGELGVVARRFYARSTIGQSMALENAMQQLAPESSKVLWEALAREKQTATQEAAVKAFKRIVGASAGAVVSDMAEDDADELREAVKGYNDLSKLIGQEFGIPEPLEVDAEAIIKAEKLSESEEE